MILIAAPRSPWKKARYATIPGKDHFTKTAPGAGDAFAYDQKFKDALVAKFGERAEAPDAEQIDSDNEEAKKKARKKQAIFNERPEVKAAKLAKKAFNPRTRMMPKKKSGGKDAEMDWIHLQVQDGVSLGIRATTECI